MPREGMGCGPSKPSSSSSSTSNTGQTKHDTTRSTPPSRDKSLQSRDKTNKPRDKSHHRRDKLHDKPEVVASGHKKLDKKKLFKSGSEPEGRQSSEESSSGKDKKGSATAMASAVLIQNWYRRYMARLERKRLYTWTIFQTLEYASEQDQLKLYQLFTDMMTHFKPLIVNKSAVDSPKRALDEQLSMNSYQKAMNSSQPAINSSQPAMNSSQPAMNSSQPARTVANVGSTADLSATQLSSCYNMTSSTTGNNSSAESKNADQTGLTEAGAEKTEAQGTSDQSFKREGMGTTGQLHKTDTKDRIELQKSSIEKALEDSQEGSEEATLLRLTNPDRVPVGQLYDGPHIQLPMTTKQLHSLIEAFKKNRTVLFLISVFSRGILHPRYVLLLLRETRAVLKELPNINRASILSAQQITVCGDLHGNLADLLLIFHKNGLPAKDNPYVFNGDFVDRGPQSVEISVLLCCFLLLSWSQGQTGTLYSVYINRGNHEDHVMNLRYGFIKEITNKYRMHAKKVVRLFQDFFSWLPLATVIDDRILVCHGGVSDVTDLQFLNQINRHKYTSALRPPNLLMDFGNEPTMPDRSEIMEWRQILDLLWSDPRSQNGCEPNSFRGGGSYFGPDVTQSVLDRHGLILLIRSHQCKVDGYEYDHNNKVLTVFSASNYYELGSNKGAYVKLGSDFQPHIVQYMSHNRPGRKLTFQQRMGIVEQSALRSLTERILSNKSSLLREYEKYDTNHSGTVKVNDWCQAMTSVLGMDLPWRSLRPKLVQLNEAGLIEYKQAFDDFKILHSNKDGDGSMLTEVIYRHKDSLEAIFRTIDVDHSGHISMEEFSEACGILSSYTKIVIPQDQVLMMARNMDLNKDGYIDFNEFLEAFRIVDQFGRDLNAEVEDDEDDTSLDSAGRSSESSGSQKNSAPFVSSSSSIVVDDWAAAMHKARQEAAASAAASEKSADNGKKRRKKKETAK